jgi:hypothetical protein
MTASTTEKFFFAIHCINYRVISGLVEWNALKSVEFAYSTANSADILLVSPG